MIHEQYKYNKNKLHINKPFSWITLQKLGIDNKVHKYHQLLTLQYKQFQEWYNKQAQIAVKKEL